MTKPTRARTAQADAEYVDPFPGRRGNERVDQVCSKCGGTGRVSTLVDSGRCWSCAGSGSVSVLVSSARSTARRRARAAAHRAATTAASTSQWSAQAAQLGDQLHGFAAAWRDEPAAADFPALVDERPTSWVTVVAYAVSEAMVLARDVGYEAAAQQWDESTRERWTPRVLGANRRPGSCVVCGVKVAVGAGQLTATDSRWLVRCAEHRA